MRRTLWAVIYSLSFCVVFSNLAFATNKTAKICNQTGQRLVVGLGFINGVIPEAEGWWAVADGTCRRFPVPNSDTITPLYAYAVGDNGTEYVPRSSTMQFCIQRNSAFDQGVASCALMEGALQGATGQKTNFLQWQNFGQMDNESFEDSIWVVQ